MAKKLYTTFYIVRHGETDWNKQKKLQGHTDIPLNKKGEAQAKKLAKDLEKIKFDLVFSSDLIRAKRTAEIIALEQKLAVQTTNVLRDRMFGKHEGKPSKPVWEEYAALTEKLTYDERFRHKIDETIESDEELVSRVITFLRETAVAYPGKTILVGAHSGVIFALLIHLGYMSYKESQMMRIANTSCLKIRTDGVDFFIDDIKGLVKRKQFDV